MAERTAGSMAGLKAVHLVVYWAVWKVESKTVMMVVLWEQCSAELKAASMVDHMVACWAGRWAD